jgi:16S rRNA (cytosine967-C5)-methyltransferase
MNRYERYLHLSAELINSFYGSEPFSNHIKRFFSDHKKLGSRDRKHISECCYAYFRTGHLLDDLDPIKRMAASLFFISRSSHPILENLYPEWSLAVSLPFVEKAKLIGVLLDMYKIFPWHAHVSNGIDNDTFTEAHLTQPDLFLRIRPGYKDTVLSQLTGNNIIFNCIDMNTIQLPNGIKINELLEINKVVVVQDNSSQRIADLFQYLPFKPSDTFDVWDICAASGGKSIMLKDHYPNTRLTVSDKRSSVLYNLEKRFHAAGLSYENSLTMDLSQPVRFTEMKKDFALIVADVPCSGSGTWSRTPEWLRFFDIDQLKHYSELQYMIIKNSIPYLRKGGYLLYSTCSVFKEENEEQVQRICSQFGLTCITEQIIKGYEQKADTMYGAVLSFQ